MVKPVVHPPAGLDLEMIRSIPQGDRAQYYEAGILALVSANGSRGLSTAEIGRATGFPKNAMLKALDALFHRRRVHRVSHGQFRLYYAHRDAPPPSRDIRWGESVERKYNARRVSNAEGDFVRIEERETDERGFACDVGAVLVPLSKVGEVISAVEAASSAERPAAEAGRA